MGLRERIKTTKRWPLLAIPALAVCAIAAVFAYAMTGPADGSPTKAETQLMTSLRRIFVPLHARSVPNPPHISSADLVEGRRIFLQTCAQCHAVNGRGEKHLAASFYPPVPDISTASMQRWSDRDLFWTVRNGIRLTGMPAWRSTLNEQQTWQVVAYVRRLADSARQSTERARRIGDSTMNLRELALRTIDEQGCRDCHRIAGEGATIGPNLSDEWTRGRSDEWLLGHFRDPGAFTPGTMMPSFSNLSDRELKALVMFLQEPK